MAKKYRKNGYNKNYNRGGQNYNNYSPNYNTSNSERMKPWWKKINWTPLIALILFLACLGGLFVCTNGFYADHLMVWNTTKAWFCPTDHLIYTDNENALVTKDTYVLQKDNGDQLKITINAEKVPIADRKYVSYTVLYYSQDDCVYQSSEVKPDYDALASDDSELVLFTYSDVDNNGPYYAKITDDEGNYITDTSRERKVDSVRVAVMYLGEDRTISLKQQVLFTEAIQIEYVS